MFGSSKEEDVKKMAAASSGVVNSLVKGTAVGGKIKCDSDIRIDGTIKGDLVCSAKLIVGPTGVIEGNVTCQSAVIEGRYKGNIRVAELLTLRETAVMEGEVTAQKIQMQSGAVFNVVCRMETGLASPAPKQPEKKSEKNDAKESVTGGTTESNA
jgi:cytoskeletal protein CcmA (bactofilin family)